MNNEDLKKLKTEEELQYLYNLMESKDYESIYEIYGKKIYNFVTPKEYKKKDIKKLAQNKGNSSIYNKYGKISTIKIKDLRKARKQTQKYALCKEQSKGVKTIRNKIVAATMIPTTIMCLIGGVCIYNEANSKPIIFDEIKIEEQVKEETNTPKINGLEIIKNIVSDDLNDINQYVEDKSNHGENVNTLKEMCALGFVNVYNQLAANANDRLFKDEQIRYEEQIENYADEINSLELNDLQIIMKVMDDTWNSIQGYGEPKKDIYGLWRLDVTAEDGVVKCRNLADDFSAKMNAINPSYNARNLPVYQNPEYYTNDSFANIDRYTVSDSSKDTSLKQYGDFTFKSDLDLSKYFGNHMVTILEIPNENITLIVDPLNLSIGTLKDGDIYMFSTIDGKGIENKELGSIIWSPIDDNFKNFMSKFNSYKYNIDLNKLEAEYGNDAQNQALDYVRNMDSNIIR